jgi:hypothetical protein
MAFRQPLGGVSRRAVPFVTVCAARTGRDPIDRVGITRRSTPRLRRRQLYLRRERAASANFGVA